MKKFDVLLKINFVDVVTVDANSSQEAREKVEEMFLAQDEMPGGPMLDWVSESLYVAKQQGILKCEILRAEEQDSD